MKEIAEGLQWMVGNWVIGKILHNVDDRHGLGIDLGTMCREEVSDLDYGDYLEDSRVAIYIPGSVGSVDLSGQLLRSHYSRLCGSVDAKPTDPRIHHVTRELRWSASGSRSR